MATYTVLNVTQINEILAAYGMKAKKVEPVDAGAGNSIYFVKTKHGRFVLTVCEEASYKECKMAAAVLEWLSLQGYPASPLIRTRSGKKVSLYQKKPIVLKKFLKGAPPSKLDPKMGRQLGEMLARLHTLPKPRKLAAEHPYLSVNLPSLKGDPDLVANKHVRYMLGRIDQLQGLIPPDLPRGLIHGDLFLDNLLYSKQDKLAAVLDFEHASDETLMFDLGMTIIGTCRKKGGGLSKKKMNALLDGYKRVRVLSPAEMEALPYFVEYTALLTACWRYWKYNLGERVAGNEGRYKEMIRFSKAVRNSDVMKIQQVLGRVF